jgi:hypothetical protein
MPDAALKVVVTVPGLRISSVANIREHWSARARRVSEHKLAVAAALSHVGREATATLRAAHRVNVRFVRLGGRKLDRDNLAAAHKACCDQVAKFLQRDDGDEERLGLEWAQEPGGAYGLRIELETADVA